MRQKSEKLRITVIETSPILLSGLVSTIKHALDCDVVFQEFAENQDYDDLKRFAPDIIVVNPVFLGLQGVKELKKKIPPSSHLVCLKTFVLDESLTNLFEAVITLYDKPDDIHHLIDRLSGYHERENLDSALTEREKEIVKLVVKGRSNKEISSDMNISVYTVSTHRRNIAKKLQIHSATAMTIYAISNNLVNINEVKSL